MELFILACIGVIAWLLYDSSHAKASSTQVDALPYDPANPNAGLSPDDPLYIPPVLGPIRNNPEYH